MTRVLIGATFCSGIGAPEVAAPWVDWRLAAEIEPFPRAVLQHRFGYLPPEQADGGPVLWGDMTQITPALLASLNVPLPDIIVAGTPCQAFSVAGQRQGTADPCGGLTLKLIEIAHAIADARPDGRLVVLWENVPGVLSDAGNAFGCFLGGIVGAMDAVMPSARPADGRSTDHWTWHPGGTFDERDDEDEPTGRTITVEPGHRLTWPGEGMVEGPRARAAWSVLDAQWFGVAQRRRRVFVVIDLGGAVDPAAVLLEPDRLRGDTPPRRETGQNPAPTLAARTRGGGGLGTDFELDGGLIANSGDVGYCLTASAQQSLDAETETLIAVAHALRGEGFDASEDDTGRGTPLVPVCFDTKGTEVQTAIDGSAPTLRAMGHANSHGNAGDQLGVAFAIQERAVSENPDAGPDGAGVRSDGTAYTLEARTVPQAVAFAENQRGELRLDDISPQITCGGGKPGQGYPAALAPTAGGTQWSVRRLTPRECERLQGFSDDHTLVPVRGKPAADGPRYKAIGNSMAVPVVRWIMDRIRQSAAAQWGRAAQREETTND